MKELIEGGLQVVPLSARDSLICKKKGSILMKIWIWVDILLIKHEKNLQILTSSNNFALYM